MSRAARDRDIVTAEARAKAVPLYRALRAAGPVGLSRDELVAAALPGSDLQDCLRIVHWMRFKGVLIALEPPRAPGDGSRFVLTPMADAFDASVALQP